mgnify:CR=1 FL=1
MQMHAQGASEAEIDAFAEFCRGIGLPVTLAELAALPQTEASVTAVVR